MALKYNITDCESEMLGQCANYSTSVSGVNTIKNTNIIQHINIFMMCIFMHLLQSTTLLMFGFERCSK
jgi:hypothetical protein